MRALVLAAALAGCAARHAGPVLSVPPPETGQVRVLAETRSGAVRRERAAISEIP